MRLSVRTYLVYYSITAFFVLVVFNVSIYKRYYEVSVRTNNVEPSQHNDVFLQRQTVNKADGVGELRRESNPGYGIQNRETVANNSELLRILEPSSSVQKISYMSKKDATVNFDYMTKHNSQGNNNLENNINGKLPTSEYCSGFLDASDQDPSSKNKLYKSVPDVTTDDDVISVLKQGCGAFGMRYKFMKSEEHSKYVTSEEKEYPISYSIVTHRNLNQLSMLLSAIYRAQNLYCVHIDAKSSHALKRGLQLISQCYSNIFPSTRNERVVYASFSRLQADVNCMRDLLATPKFLFDWKHCINLCGQDFPVSTNFEIVQQLKELKEKNTVAGTRDLNDIARLRVEYVHKVINITNENNETVEIDHQTLERHRPPPFNMSVIKNLAYNTFTREFLQWALIDSEEGSSLLNWSSVTHTPDEHFWGMLNAYPGAPGGSSYVSWWQAARAIMWKNNKANNTCHGYWARGVCVLGAEDLTWIMNVRQMFINKFDVTHDVTPVACIRTFLDERTIGRNSTKNKHKKPLQLPWQMLETKK